VRKRVISPRLVLARELRMPTVQAKEAVGENAQHRRGNPAEVLGQYEQAIGEWHAVRIDLERESAAHP